MKRSTFGRTAIPAALAITLALAACGGSDDDTTDDTSATDAAATDEAPASDDGAEPATDISGTLNGSGASSQQAAQQAWIAALSETYPDLVVNYDPVGSGGGREAFLSGAADFAGSDAALDDEELAASVERCEGTDGAIDIPVYVSPIALVYNLADVEELQLAPATIAGIFTGAITTWNDAAIAADNPDATLPDTAITPVHRSDASGTSRNFTAYLSAVAAEVWTYEDVEDWPAELGGEGAQGTSGVIEAVTAGEGAIGYADASQAGDLGTAAVQVGTEYVTYSPEAAGAILDVSSPVEGRNELDLALEIDRATEEPGVYPIVLVSYAIACLQYEDPATAANVKAYLGYLTSEEGQAAAAEQAGAAPLPATYIDLATTSVDAIS